MLALPGILLAAIVLVLASCTASGTKSAAGAAKCGQHGAAVARGCAPRAGAAATAASVPHFKHIVVAVFDNMSYSQVIGSKFAPYFNQLARGGASFTQSFAETYPGQPNYLALYSSGTKGVTDDSCPHTFGTPNLGARLAAAGLSFTGYVEDLPASGPGVCTSGNYTRTHVPWANFSNVPASATQSFNSFPQAAGDNFAALPTVSFVTPNICHDMTTCGIGTGNAWLQNRLSAYAQWALTNQSLLIVTFAKDNGTSGNHIPTIFYGDQVIPGQYSEQINHYNVLRTIEDAYGLPHDGHTAGAAPITDVWSTGTTSPSPSPSTTSPSPSPSTTSPSPSPSTTSPSPSSPPPAGVPQFQHVVIVIFENHAYSQVIGSSSAPYLNQLANTGASFTQSFAVTHPSQPNYLALFSGSTQGITDDSCPHTFHTPNLATDLTGAGKTFAGYVDSLPSSGATVCSSGNYARKHAPWVNWPSVPASETRNFTSFPQTASGDFAALPTVSYVIPNLCNDMHNCSVATGDAWMSSHMNAYAQWAKANNSLLIATFDEDNGSHGNQIATIFYGAHVTTGKYSTHITHYSLLRTLEDAYGLPHDGAAASATPITDIWAAG
jgi:phosphatidylinositol-3-phosphatase